MQGAALTRQRLVGRQDAIPQTERGAYLGVEFYRLPGQGQDHWNLPTYCNDMEPRNGCGAPREPSSCP
jgi:hypothetical protein